MSFLLIDCRNVRNHIETVKMHIFVIKPQLKPEVTGYGSADKDMLFRELYWNFLQILGHSAYDPKMPDHTNLSIKELYLAKNGKF